MAPDDPGVAGAPDLPDPLPRFRIEHEPFAGFELVVLVDRGVYSAADPVRITVTAANRGDRFAEHRYRGWQRYHLSVRDHLHRVVADDVVDRPADQPMLDRWLPGQLLITPTYWDQTAGPIVPGWTGEAPGPRVEPGRYRVRATWLGREAGSRAELPDAWSPWFELV
ncbi:hypothetical protein FTX61_12500 [Nitriliruptoraceae bacterium ZYF776]|nr:hypothetical protein [Profundirhabdus halotolerans]